MARITDKDSLIKAIVSQCEVMYSMETMEDTLHIQLDIEKMINEITNPITKISPKVESIKVHVGSHVIKMKKEVEVVKIVKTKGFNIIED